MEVLYPYHFGGCSYFIFSSKPFSATGTNLLTHIDASRVLLYLQVQAIPWAPLPVAPDLASLKLTKRFLHFQ
jgi:hypothetical protein